MSKARCDTCGGFAPLNFDRHGRTTCPYCGQRDFDRNREGARLGVALLAVSGVLSVLMIYAAWRTVAALIVS